MLHCICIDILVTLGDLKKALSRNIPIKFGVMLVELKMTTMTYYFIKKCS